MTTEILEPLTITQGEDATYVIFAVQAGVAFDASNCKVFFTVKRKWKDTTALILKRTTNAGGSDAQVLVITPQTGVTKGRIEVYVSAADTEALDPDKTYVCDAWIQTTDNKKHVCIRMRDFDVWPRVSVLP